MGTELVACILVGAGGGYALDSWAGSSPLALAAGTLLGMLAGFVQLYRTVRGLEGDSGGGR